MTSLSYLSKLRDLINAEDDDLRRDIGYLSPSTVTEYVFYLRQQIRSLKPQEGQRTEEEQQLNSLKVEVDILRAEKAQATAEIARLRAQVDQLTQEDPSGAAPSCPPATPPPRYTPPENGITPNVTPPGYGRPSSDLPPLDPDHELPVRLRYGSVITVRGVYVEGTTKFTINLVKADQSRDRFIAFHLDFRPAPHGNCVVMNSEEEKEKKWHPLVVKTELPPMRSGADVLVDIVCLGSEFMIFVNENRLKKNFPFRYPLEEISKVNLVHGNVSIGNKWVALHVPAHTTASPYTPGLWSWLHDGKRQNRCLELTNEGKIRWDFGSPGGYWKYNAITGIFTFQLNDLATKHEICWAGNRGILLDPHRNPPSVMYPNPASHPLPQNIPLRRTVDIYSYANIALFDKNMTGAKKVTVDPAKASFLGKGNRVIEGDSQNGGHGWRVVPGLAGQGVSFKYETTGHYLRHDSGLKIYADKLEGNDAFKADATFIPTPVPSLGLGYFHFVSYNFQTMCLFSFKDALFIENARDATMKCSTWCFNVLG